MASSHPQFTTHLEHAAFALAKESGSRYSIPTDSTGNLLSTADVAHMLLSLPRQSSKVRTLARLLETEHRNIPLDMIGRWHALRQELEVVDGDDEAAEKENAPPLPLAKLDHNDVPTRSAEGDPTSPPQPVIPMPLSPHASCSVLASPTLQSSFGQTSLVSPDPSSDAPGPSNSMLAVPLPPADMPSYVVAVSQDVAVASERNDEEAEGLVADCSTPDDVPEFPSLQDEDNPGANTTSSPSLASYSSSSNSLRSSMFAQNPPSPTLHTRLVRSNGVSNFQDLKLALTSQETATSDADFFDMPPVNAINARPLFNPVPPLAAHSIMNSGNHDLQSPTPATGTDSRDRLRGAEEEEEVVLVDGAEQDWNLDGQTSNIASSTSNRRKRAREDDQEREDDRPPANRDGQDNFAARFWRRLKRYMP